MYPYNQEALAAGPKGFTHKNTKNLRDLMIKNFHLENWVRFTQHQSHYIKVQKEGFILDGLIFRERGGTLCARDFLGSDI